MLQITRYSDTEIWCNFGNMCDGFIDINLYEWVANHINDMIIHDEAHCRPHYKKLGFTVRLKTR